ncbi:gliding motility lipoprotein GldB [Gilvibacter sediminis]|uniref:gliding motility lipoprotein GldB n=1 Tax=Gilvibacter sediminis TaxID=379071 RepID=UPI0023508C2F|nr:gliding motility lipoprotein GldB [Gilvibacter sediminis]MDC7998658.1 gliding motility lipoprotein GldB [Gilvibacter sediminis]
MNIQKSLVKSSIYWAFVLIFGLLFACSDAPQVKPEVLDIEIQTDVIRFDLEFDRALESEIPQLKAKYPQLFPQQYPDSFWVAKKRDTLLQALAKEVQQAYPDFTEQEEELNLLFKHLKYYFPDFTPPTVYTVLSEVDYKDPVLWAGDQMSIGLDNYLGAEHPFYEGIPLYIAANMKSQQIVADVANLASRAYVPPARNRSFLGQMLYHGKLLYLQTLLLPLESEATLMGYSEAQYQWATENEMDIWRYFVEREVLYDTNPKLLNQFINPAPFSKFYLEIDNESPGRIGRYMGLQMVKAFAENTDSSLAELLTTPADQLYQQSKYKPKK